MDVSVKKLKKQQAQRGMVYRTIRAMLGLSQAELGKLIGCSKDAIAVREYRKRTYTVDELVKLQQLSGLSDVEWMELLRQIAK
jgi:transcriptional regulator with XRE-family HTH domain